MKASDAEIFVALLGRRARGVVNRRASDRAFENGRRQGVAEGMREAAKVIARAAGLTPTRVKELVGTK